MSEPADIGIEHVVLLKVRDEATSEELQRFVDGVKSLRIIPGIVSITVGSSFVEDFMEDRRKGYSHILRVRLRSKEALRTYQDHELHLKVIKECIKPVISDPPLAVDWESNLSVSENSSGPYSAGVDHVVLAKIRDEATPEQLQRLIDESQHLQVIPGVVSISVGKTFVTPWMDDRRRGYGFGIRVRLSSKEALHVYHDHDLHVKVKKECILPIVAEPPLAVDWESPLIFGEN